MYRLESSNLTKRFGARTVLRDISLALSQGESLAITGANGSGKTTLLLSLLRQYRPDQGTVVLSHDTAPLDPIAIRASTALVAPYFQMYGELTGEENLRFFLSVCGCDVTGKEISAALERVGLAGRGSDLLRTYSSGMHQRLRLAHAHLKQAPFLFLDEPFVNLDASGKQIASALITEWCNSAIVVIATNEPDEQALAQKTFQLT